LLRKTGTAFGVVEEPMRRWVVPGELCQVPEAKGKRNELTRLDLKVDDWSAVCLNNESTTFVGYQGCRCALFVERRIMIICKGLIIIGFIFSETSLVLFISNPSHVVARLLFEIGRANFIGTIAEGRRARTNTG